MTDIVRRFAVRLSQDAIARLFVGADLPAPNLEGLGPRQRTQRVVERILKAPDAKRGRLEGIAGHVLALPIWTIMRNGRCERCAETSSTS